MKCIATMQSATMIDLRKSFFILFFTVFETVRVTIFQSFALREIIRTAHRIAPTKQIAEATGYEFSADEPWSNTNSPRRNARAIAIHTTIFISVISTRYSDETTQHAERRGHSDHQTMRVSGSYRYYWIRIERIPTTECSESLARVLSARPHMSPSSLFPCGDPRISTQSPRTPSTALP
jgi:hypothetical protein